MTPGDSRPAAAARTIRLDAPLDLRSVLGPLARGTGDPTMRVAAGAAIRASVTVDGPAAIELHVDGTSVHARAWGPGADRLLDGLPAALGLDDDDTGFDPSLHPVVAGLARRLGRVRLGRTGAVWEALLPAILEQRITGTEASRNYRRLARAHGEPAPGPLGLVLAPVPATVAGLPSWTLTGLGIEPRRGALLRRIAREAVTPGEAGGARPAARRRGRRLRVPCRGAARPRRDRAVDGRGGDPACPWRPGRGERGGCPPVERRGVRADGGPARHGRAHARAPCALGGPPGAGHPADRALRDHPAALRASRRAPRPRPRLRLGPRRPGPSSASLRRIGRDGAPRLPTGSRPRRCRSCRSCPP